ncbi:hypothetical protein [Cerasicoccus maritimus]|uniref:hypothetical protein n=1 Tax=Cerasicoccus maritimus TaxID=490089 RepID=UPI0028526A11|nr:hypothetical protein [Cerasicoccus maritimus]
MSEETNERHSTKIMADIAAFAYETGSLPDDVEAQKYLAENGLDNTNLKNWGLEKLKAVKARKKLKQAAEAHRQFTQHFNAIRAKVASNSSALRKRVMDKLQVLASSDQEVALVYCRKFENTPDEDLLDLEAEIMMLDQWDDASDK